MWVRERDAFDYAIVSAVTALAWLHYPFRYEVYRTIHLWAALLQRWVEESPTEAIAVAVVVVALLGGAFLAGLVRSAAA